jgi:3-dehydroquinate synthetase
VLAADRERFYAEKILLPPLRVELGQLNIAGDDVIAAMQQDKKRTGAGLPLVMIGDADEMVRIDDLTEAEVRTALGLLTRLPAREGHV